MRTGNQLRRSSSMACRSARLAPPDNSKWQRGFFGPRHLAQVDPLQSREIGSAVAVRAEFESYRPYSRLEASFSIVSRCTRARATAFGRTWCWNLLGAQRALRPELHDSAWARDSTSSTLLTRGSCRLVDRSPRVTNPCGSLPTGARAKIRSPSPRARAGSIEADRASDRDCELVTEAREVAAARGAFARASAIAIVTRRDRKAECADVRSVRDRSKHRTFGSKMTCGRAVVPSCRASDHDGCRRWRASTARALRALNVGNHARALGR